MRSANFAVQFKEAARVKPSGLDGIELRRKLRGSMQRKGEGQTEPFGSVESRSELRSQDQKRDG